MSKEIPDGKAPPPQNNNNNDAPKGKTWGDYFNYAQEGLKFGATILSITATSILVYQKINKNKPNNDNVAYVDEYKNDDESHVIVDAAGKTADDVMDFA